MNTAELEKCTEAFIRGAEHMASQSIDLDTIINSLIGAAITCAYAAKTPPENLERAFYAAAGQVRPLYEQQDRVAKGRVN